MNLANFRYDRNGNQYGLKRCKYHCDYGDGEYCHYKEQDGCIYNKIQYCGECGETGMTDKEKAMLWLKSFVKNKEPMTLIPKQLIRLMYDALKEQPDIVRCKDCVHRGKIEKCVLAAIAAEKDYPLFMLDNRGEWYCADGERKDDGHQRD